MQVIQWPYRDLQRNSLKHHPRLRLNQVVVQEVPLQFLLLLLPNNHQPVSVVEHLLQDHLLQDHLLQDHLRHLLQASLGEGVRHLQPHHLLHHAVEEEVLLHLRLQVVRLPLPLHPRRVSR